MLKSITISLLQTKSIIYKTGSYERKPWRIKIIDEKLCDSLILTINYHNNKSTTKYECMRLVLFHGVSKSVTTP